MLNLRHEGIHFDARPSVAAAGEPKSKGQRHERNREADHQGA